MTLGVQLFDAIRIWEEWQKAKPHVACLQDSLGVELYTKTGTMLKGGIQLNVYRCARGSVSLESFHFHLNRFIPGNVSCPIYIVNSGGHFQRFLVHSVVND